ncbi:hypothetical protein UFOVP928_43 [uncultured Caudovirales phage]|uniref:Uncharacterized protein n=1 Tax=uncultured Caudovirales phage TaxID=2100421 RepID=A0A6J5RRA5_9CAUD|nr:hypothetical protein UFOVP578_14 [uncultured Caudovirales phage]CAB4172069.1 hypothetical protein UFOVP928_43 [uncultured Caudovirales phage]CAB4184034.1 hypothetical protein UFOVP1098_28 [uncultured Caudovirales phage]CAB4199793.1 hypothetical protein UFOVP1353_5 [uncultured Caudovirales phage]CAB4214133.1 hypothetical protein UFOVP1458_17 [uncultured Caudovirales phage]
MKPCIEGHKHTDSAWAKDSEPTTHWFCSSCEQEFESFQELMESEEA